MKHTINISDVIRLLRRGLSYVAIADLLNCHPNTIGYHAKRLGIAARRAKR